MDIRLRKTDSINSKNDDTLIKLEMEQTSKLFSILDFSTKIDAYQTFINERENCNTYRLILTINPYCTNVIFNTCTEIVKNEGDNNREVVLDNMPKSFNNLINTNIYGKRTNIKRSDMISNTEYSRDQNDNDNVLNYEYHPGYDIYDNHIFRNLSFKTVNQPNSTIHNNPEHEVFNTISDYMRYFNGDFVSFRPRYCPISTNSINISGVNPGFYRKHLYNIFDIRSYSNGDAINDNLIVENGWYGFKNNSAIDSKEYENNEYKKMDISRVINNKGNCDFIDMYPDRTLYSFNPKYNEFKHKMEYNWDVYITYPYKNFYKHPLIMDDSGNGELNALAIMWGKKMVGLSGNDIIMFRTYTKHGLKKGDRISLYFSYSKIDDNGFIIFDTDYQECNNFITITNIGDLNNENNDYYFYTNELSCLDDIFSKDSINLDLFYNSSTTATVGNEYVFYTSPPTDYPDDNKVNFYIYSYVQDDTSNCPTDTPILDEIPKYITESSSNYIIVNNICYLKTIIYYDLKNNIDQIINNAFSKDLYVNVDELQKNGNISSIVEIDSNGKYKYTTSKPCGFIFFRFQKYYYGQHSKYYIRIFKKLPNFKYKKDNLTNEIGFNRDVFDNFVKINASEDLGNNNYKMYDFNSEQYKLAFAKTIYNDDITQYTFIDDINILNIFDNLNRPLTTLYITIVKRNKGYKEWYGYNNSNDLVLLNEKSISKDFSSDNIEYSHCFGTVTSGINFATLSEDSDGDLTRIKSKYSDAHCLNNHKTSDNNYNVNNSLPLEFFSTQKGIDENTEMFFGDIVEYKVNDAIENTLDDVYFRFNTAQREIGDQNEYSFTWHDIITDDYDINNDGDNNITSKKTCFKVQKYGYSNDEKNYIIRDEGYIYKAHYPIPIREFGQINQSSHYTLEILKSEPIQMNGIYIKVSCLLKHKLKNGETVYICDDINNIWYETKVSYVKNDYVFVIEPISRDVDSQIYHNWVETCELINSKNLILRKKNTDIPNYAENIGNNVFLWRNINNVGNKDNKTLPEYLFSNNSFYISSSINFFLKRQDAEQINGLFYYDNFPSDISGEIYKTSSSNYIYNNGINSVC